MEYGHFRIGRIIAENVLIEGAAQKQRFHVGAISLHFDERGTRRIDRTDFKADEGGAALKVIEADRRQTAIAIRQSIASARVGPDRHGAAVPSESYLAAGQSNTGAIPTFIPGIPLQDAATIPDFKAVTAACPHTVTNHLGALTPTAFLAQLT